MMPTTLIDYLGLLPAFALVLSRLAGLTITAPLFSSQAVPMRLKGLFVAAMALSIFPVVAPGANAHLSLSEALVGLLGEFALGAALGLGIGLVLGAAQVAGLTVSQQAGLAISQVLDPMMGGGASLLAEVYYIIAAMMFLAVGGERELVRALLDSFSAVPLMGFRPDADVFGFLSDVLAESFVLAVQLAAPAIIALLLTSVAIGFLARTVPQLNVISIGFSLKAVVALVVLMGAFPLASSAFDGAFADFFSAFRQLLRGTGG
jgi:flagellar biosynthetic protein FliR